MAHCDAGGGSRPPHQKPIEIDRRVKVRVYLRNMGASEATIDSFIVYLEQTRQLKEWCDRRGLRPYRLAT